MSSTVARGPPAPRAAAAAAPPCVSAEASAPAAAPSPGMELPPPRLIITHMVLENFKSFGGTKVIGPFHDKFSAIVGPNGNGKSNCVDALLFVLGRRAKALRLSKVSDLIHKSAAYPDLTQAKVTVSFQEVQDIPAPEAGTADQPANAGTVQPCPGTEFTVSRTAYSNNTSKYAVNDRTVTFAEVAELLKSKGVDLDNNRFLILQGEVEAISLMKPKGLKPGEEGLLEYLEDIIGSNVYVPQIEEAGAKLEELNEARQEKLNRVKAAEKDKAALLSAKEDAEQFLQADADVQSAKWDLLHAQQARAQAKRADAAARAEEHAGKLQVLETELTERAAAMEAENTAVKQTNAALSKARAAEEKAAAAFAEIDKSFVALSERRKAAKKRMKAATTKATKQRAETDAASARAEELQAQLPDMTAAVAAAEARHAAATSAYDEALHGIQARTAEMRVKLEAKEAELQPWADAVAAAASELNTARTRAELVQERVAGIAQELEAASTTRAELQAEAQRHTEGKASAETELAAAQTQLSSLTTQLAQAEKAEASARASAKAAQSAVEEKRAALASAAGRSRLVTAMLGASRPGGPLENAGLYGRLGDLGTVDAKYDVAVSTACPRLHSLVTASTDGAQACVEWLRKHNAGRARFVMLDKLGYMEASMDAPVKLPAGAVRLFDCVQVSDPALRIAFWYAMGNTLVAPDLDAAVAMAYKGNKAVWRVVTLAGELIDVSGTMSGGKGVSRGALRLAAGKGSAAATAAASAAASTAVVTEADVKAAQAAARQAATAAASAAQDREELSQAVVALEERVPELQAQVAAAQRGLQQCAARLKALDARVKELKAMDTSMSAADAAELQAAQQELGGAEKKHARAVAQAAKYEAAVEQLRDVIKHASADELGGVKAECDAASKAVKSARTAERKANAECKAATRAAERAAAAAECADAEATEAEAEKQAIDEQVQDLEAQGEAALRACHESKAERETAEVAANAAVEAAAGLTKRLRALEDEIAAVRAVIVQCDADMRAVDAALKEIGTDCATTAAAYAACQELLWEAPEEPDESGMADDDAETMPALQPLTAEQLGELPSEDALTLKLQACEDRRANLKGEMNMGAIAEYRARERDLLQKVAELTGVTRARDRSRAEFEGLRTKRLDEFMAGFAVIARSLKQMYQMITLGGDADLELVDSMDPFGEGIQFSVRPPKKSWKNIANLSGGEKTLSSLALVFALHYYKPTPLYVMDEIDAALDFKNVSIVANYIKERTTAAQFIIISLRNNMFELADRLIGIYKTFDVTKSVTLDPAAVAAQVEAARAAV